MEIVIGNVINQSTMASVGNTETSGRYFLFFWGVPFVLELFGTFAGVPLLLELFGPLLDFELPWLLLSEEPELLLLFWAMIPRGISKFDGRL